MLHPRSDLRNWPRSSECVVLIDIKRLIDIERIAAEHKFLEISK